MVAVGLLEMLRFIRVISGMAVIRMVSMLVVGKVLVEVVGELVVVSNLIAIT